MSLIFSDKYFDAFPDKVLGDISWGYNKFGNHVKTVSSKETVEQIANRIMADLPKPKKQPWHLNIKREPKEVNKIAEAIAKTKHLAQNPPDIKGLDLISFEEMQTNFGTEISKEEIEAWVWYQRGRMFSDSAILSQKNGWGKYIVPAAEQEKHLTRWIDAGVMCFDGREYLPAVLFYAGNIYQRIQKVKENKEAVVAEIGENKYNEQLDKLEKAKPERLKLLAPESERLFISPLDPFVSQVFISRLADGTIFDNELSLLRAFKEWMHSLPNEAFVNGSSVYEIRNYYLGNERFPNNTNPEEKVEIKRRAQIDCLALFSKFLYEGLSREDQQIVEYRWNANYNAFTEFNYKKIPVGFEINRYFKNAPLEFRPALWEGVKFLNVNGSGICAFDVGVGKTMTAILTVAQALYTGQCKRPLIVVPNPTYKKWIKECIGEFNADGTVKVHGVLPQYKDRINDFYNLGVDKEKSISEIWPKDYTITFITFEGLMRLGLSRFAQDELSGELYKILNQGDLKKRDAEKLREQIDEILGGITSDTIANFDDLGFDYVVVDEAHNFKKIFTRVKGRVSEDKKERESSPYQLSSGEPSGRGLKLFALAQYVLRKNAMRNVLLLTATPFTNSPLEIYSMLSLVAYQQLEQRGISNLIDFFDKFINEEQELSVTIRGKFESRPVIKTFNNRQVLQNIIFSSIIYKTGEEAGVPRPKKIVYPYLKDASGIFLKPDERIETSLQPTPDQDYWLKQIAKFANAAADNQIEPLVPRSYYDDRKKLPGRDLMAISLAQNCTLSPYLMRIGGEDGVKIFEDTAPDYLQFIESSPKLKYVCECIRTVKQWHEGRQEPVSGQVIYMNMATGYFPMIKEYLVKQIGYQPKEVEIIIGGIAQTKKEAIKDKFLAGEIKIIIGSGTIKEGIDLQNRSTVLYNCNMDWNPTDIQQLEGRIWRQGNKHSHVRIVTPMVENSLDVFLFQKLEEKTSRINDIWYRKGRGNVLKLEDFDPKELKMGLMTDPAERVKAELELELTKLKNRKTIYDGNVEKIGQAQREISNSVSAAEKIEQYYATSKEKLEFALTRLAGWLADPDLAQSKREQYESKQRTITELLEREPTEKAKIAVCKRYAKELMGESGYGYNYEANRIITECDYQLKRMALLESIQKNILEPKGLTMADDLEPIIAENRAEADAIKAEMDKISSPDYFDEKVAEVRAEMAEKKKLSKPIADRVKEFTRHNYLLSCLKDIHHCSLDSTEIKAKPKEAVPEAKVIQLEPNNTDKAKRLRIAKAKAAALKLKLSLLAA
jgi:hypothetical protein